MSRLVADHVQAHLGPRHRVDSLEVYFRPDRDNPLAYGIARPTYDGRWSVGIPGQRGSAVAIFKDGAGLIELDGKEWSLVLWCLPLDSATCTGVVSNGSESDRVEVFWYGADFFHIEFVSRERCTHCFSSVLNEMCLLANISGGVSEG